MKTLDEVLKENIIGMYFGNRIVLPFSANILKVVIESEIITDFSPGAKGACIIEHRDHMDIYFNEYKDIKSIISKYEIIKMIIVESSENIFDFSKHRKIALHLLEDHKIKIEELTDDILFIE